MVEAIRVQIVAGCAILFTVGIGSVYQFLLSLEGMLPDRYFIGGSISSVFSAILFFFVVLPSQNPMQSKEEVATMIVLGAVVSIFYNCWFAFKHFFRCIITGNLVLKYSILHGLVFLQAITGIYGNFVLDHGFYSNRRIPNWPYWEVAATISLWCIPIIVFWIIFLVFYYLKNRHV